MDYFNQTWRMFFEAIPVIAALVTIVLAGRRALLTTNTHSRNACIGFIIAAFLLITAQTSWSWTLFIQKNLLGTDFANIIWTVFNLVTMLTMSYAVQWAAKK